MKNGFFALAIVIMLSGLGFARQGSAPEWLQGGIRNSSGSRAMRPSQQRRLLESLRRKTGWRDLQFDAAGFLTPGDRMNFGGGSAAARELLLAAMEGRVAIELEAACHSPHIAFARITGGTVYASFRTREKIEVRKVQLDFADFAELRGDPAVIEAFDPGMALLHELVHGTLGLFDAVGETGRLGECDEVVNRIRRELHLPERQGYSARVRAMPGSHTGITLLAELAFASTNSAMDRNESKRFYLRWEARRVADPSAANQAAQGR